MGCSAERNQQPRAAHTFAMATHNFEAMAAKLEKLSGDAFDKEYMKQAGLNDHKATHAKLQKISKSAKDADVKAAADKTLPTVEQHLKAAQQMSSAKSGTTSGK